MSEPEIVQSLSSATSDVLETMFFSSVIAEGEVGSPGPDAIAARLEFSGARQGVFAVRLTAGAAQVITANFLAEETDEPTREQVLEVTCELANMLCGSALSRLDRGAHFELGAPAMVEAEAIAALPGLSRAFDIGDGEVAVFLRIDGNS